MVSRVRCCYGVGGGFRSNQTKSKASASITTGVTMVNFTKCTSNTRRKKVSVSLLLVVTEESVFTAAVPSL